MKVFIQLNDETGWGVAVKRGMQGFDVLELQKGVSNAHFTYRVVAKRRDFEDLRLEYSKAGENDPYLYPETKGLRPQQLLNEIELKNKR